MSPYTVQQCIEIGEQQFVEAGLFFGHGTDNAFDESMWLVFHHLGLDFNSDDSVLQVQITVDDYDAIQALFQRRIDERIPTAYLTGKAWFAGHPFIVNADVLVPRSPIAELIGNGYQPWLPANVGNSPRILDLCTGSGCIGIVSALVLPAAQVLLSDISTAALAVAERNIAHHGVGDRVTAIESDLFNAIDAERFDLIVTNPPYVDADDLSAMPAEYQAEPELGLASGVDGLDFTRRLLRQAPDYMAEEGILICEVGNSWVNLEAAFPSVPFLWLEFEHGGYGIFVISRSELLEYQAEFR